MVCKKIEREVIRAIRRKQFLLPSTLALMMSMSAIASAAEPVEPAEEVSAEAELVSDIADEPEREELSSELEEFNPMEVDAEVNEDSLRYLLLEDFFVTAERIPSKRMNTPAEVAVITSAEIDANHYQSVDEALSHVNGMVMGFINGSDRVLTLVDGHRTFLYPPMKAIDRIEIVKGGGSALYGSDAVGGVINIITKRGDHDETHVDVNTGSWHRHNYEITNQGNDGKLGWFIDAGIGQSRPNAYNSNDDYDNKHVSIRLDHRFDERNSLTFDFMHYSDRSNKYRTRDNEFAFDSYFTPKYELANQLSLSYNFKEGSSTPGFLRYFNNYSDVDTTLRGKGTSRLQGVDYQNGWESGQHKFIIGAEWHQSSDKNERWSNAQKKITNQAYYLQDTISMGNKWTLVPGTRFDHNSQFGSQWSPKVAANYSPDDKTKIFASWGRVYQAPDVHQLYTSWYPAALSRNDIPYYYIKWHGNKNLNPETGHTETIGIEHDFSDKVNASLTFFNAKISNYLDLNDYGGTYANTESPYGFRFYDLEYVNSSEDKQHGAILSYRQKLDDHWSYNLGYAYTHRERPLGQESYISHWRAPKNSYRAAIRYQNGPWKASLQGVMGTGSDGNLYMEDDFAFLDFNVSCEVSDWATVYAKAINFTNQHHSYYGGKNAAGKLFQFGLDCYF